MNAIDRMQRAQAMLEDELFNEAFTEIEKAIVNRLKLGATDKDAEWLLSLRLMAKIKGYFVGVAQSGKVELHEAQAKEARKK